LVIAEKYSIIIAYMRFLDTILEIIFPSKCVVCQRGGAELCLSCISSSPQAERKSAEWIFPLYDYRHPPIKKALWSLKYYGRRRIALLFAEAIYEKMMEELGEMETLQNFKAPLLIPIPLSPKRTRERGFNQAELICREVIKINSLRQGKRPRLALQLKTDILLKPKDTEHQARIRDRAERLKNISGSFSITDSSGVRGKNIILVDDILTTGATLSEARRILKNAGARKVVAFTVAH
jgi:ComF family protein